MAHERLLRWCESNGERVITNRYHVWLARQYEGVKMIYLEATDIIAVTIALTASLILIVSTVLRNIQLTHQRDSWRDKALGLVE